MASDPSLSRIISKILKQHINDLSKSNKKFRQAASSHASEFKNIVGQIHKAIDFNNQNFKRSNSSLESTQQTTKQTTETINNIASTVRNSTNTINAMIKQMNSLTNFTAGNMNRNNTVFSRIADNIKDLTKKGLGILGTVGAVASLGVLKGGAAKVAGAAVVGGAAAYFGTKQKQSIDQARASQAEAANDLPQTGPSRRERESAESERSSDAKPSTSPGGTPGSSDAKPSTSPGGTPGSSDAKPSTSPGGTPGSSDAKPSTSPGGTPGSSDAKPSTSPGGTPGSSDAKPSTSPGGTPNVIGGYTSTDQIPQHGGSKFSREFGFHKDTPQGRVPIRGGEGHAGLDIPIKTGQPFKAHMDGIVIKKSFDKTGYGHYIDVKFADGTIHRFAHMGSNDGKVKPFGDGIEVGKPFKKGDTLGFGGYSGNARPGFPHVHNEMWQSRGKPGDKNYQSADHLYQKSLEAIYSRSGIPYRDNPRPYWRKEEEKEEKRLEEEKKKQDATPKPQTEAQPDASRPNETPGTAPGAQQQSQGTTPKAQQQSQGTTPGAPGTAPNKVMYGLPGLGGRFDQKSFERYARAQGYNPVVIWGGAEELKRQASQLGQTPYAIYGYSKGAEVGRDSILAGLKPERFIAVGASKKMRKDNLPVPTEYHGDTSSDSHGNPIIDPNTGKLATHEESMRALADRTEQQRAQQRPPAYTPKTPATPATPATPPQQQAPIRTNIVPENKIDIPTTINQAAIEKASTIPTQTQQTRAVNTQQPIIAQETTSQNDRHINPLNSWTPNLRSAESYVTQKQQQSVAV